MGQAHFNVEQQKKGARGRPFFFVLASIYGIVIGRKVVWNCWV